MPKSDSRLERAQLLAALKALKEAKMEFRGPFASSKGTVVVVENTILRKSELIDLYTGGQLTREGIRKFLEGQNARRAGA
jgi:hypothetical protein